MRDGWAKSAGCDCKGLRIRVRRGGRGAGTFQKFNMGGVEFDLRRGWTAGNVAAFWGEQQPFTVTRLWGAAFFLGWNWEAPGALTVEGLRRQWERVCETLACASRRRGSGRGAAICREAWRPMGRARCRR